MNRAAQIEATTRLMRQELGSEWRSGDPVEVSVLVRLLQRARRKGYHSAWQRWHR